MKEIIKNSLILLIITLIAGISISFVYELTKNPIKENENKVKNKAYLKVIPDGKDFKNIDFSKDAINEFLKNNNINTEFNIIDEIVSAHDKEDKIIGYCITVTNKEGYANDIQFTVGILIDATIKDISILKLSETPGLGMKAKDDVFLTEFKNKKVKAFVVSKEKSEKDEEVSAITGATITSTAFVNGVNSAIIAFDYIVSNIQKENITTDSTLLNETTTLNTEETTLNQ